jgi:two-component system, NarL family, sensor kinase
LRAVSNCCFYASLAVILIVANFSAEAHSIFSTTPEDCTDTICINQTIARAFHLLDYNVDSAYVLAKRAFIDSKKINYANGVGSALMCIANVWQEKGSNDSSLAYYRKALAVRKSGKNNLQIGYAYSGVGLAFEDMMRYDSAIVYQMKAVHIFEKQPDSTALANGYLWVGILFGKLKDYNQSIQFVNKAIPLFTDLKNTLSLAQAYNQMGVTLSRQYSFQKALTYFYKAKELCESAHDISTLEDVYENIGKTKSALHDTAGYLANLRKEATIQKKMSLQNDLANTYMTIGEFFLGGKHADSAISNLSLGLKISEADHDTTLIAEAYNGLSGAYELKHNYDKALYYQKKYSTLHDMSMDIERQNTIAQINAQYKTEEKEKQNELLSKQNKIDETQRNAFIIVSVLLILVLGGGLYLFKQKEKLAFNKELIANQRIDGLLKGQELNTYSALIEGEEKERQRIAADLHDRLGSLLATVKMHFNGLEDKMNGMAEENKIPYLRANSLLDEACNEVRVVSHNLSSGTVMSFGLIPALQELCERLESSGEINCKLLSYGEFRRMEASTEISIYRIVQELFSNSLRHADAKNITVQVNQLEDSLNVTVEDDGTGFNSTEKKITGIGFQNIQTRVEKLHSKFTIDSSPGKGTIAILDVPAEKINL